MCGGFYVMDIYGVMRFIVVVQTNEGVLTKRNGFKLSVELIKCEQV